QQLVIQRQINYPRRQVRCRWSLIWTQERAHGLRGGNRASLQQQSQRGFHLRLTAPGRQMQNPEIVLVGAQRLAATQAIVGLAKQQRGKERVVVAVLRKGAGLPHQRVDQVAIVNLLLVLSTHPRQRLQARGTEKELRSEEHT